MTTRCTSRCRYTTSPSNGNRRSIVSGRLPQPNPETTSARMQTTLTFKDSMHHCQSTAMQRGLRPQPKLSLSATHSAAVIAVSVCTQNSLVLQVSVIPACIPRLGGRCRRSGQVLLTLALLGVIRARLHPPELKTIEFDGLFDLRARKPVRRVLVRAG